jgi:predicted DNA-binding transcriptional regulator
MDWTCKTWTGPWTGLVKHGLAKHGLVKHGLVKHGLAGFILTCSSTQNVQF